jgi:hypothetical protein
MYKYRMELVDTCSMRSGIFECNAKNKKEALEKIIEIRISGGSA